MFCNKYGWVSKMYGGFLEFFRLVIFSGFFKMIFEVCLGGLVFWN